VHRRRQTDRGGPTGTSVPPTTAAVKVLVRLAAPAPGARRRRLSGGRARPARRQPLGQAAPGARLPTQGAGPGRGRPDRGPGRRLGHRRRPRLGRRPGLAAGHAAPERIERLVVLNAPHPIRFLEGLGNPGSCGAAGPSSPSSSPGYPSGSWRPGTSRRCAGPYDANRPGRAPSPPRPSTATSPRPPSPAPCAPPSTTTGPPCAPTRSRTCPACAAWTPRPSSSGQTRTATWTGNWRPVPGVNVQRA
jgi:hypothetical protein